MNNLQTPTWMRCAEVILALALSTGAHAAPPFTVNSTADMVDDSPGNGACHTAANTCTLRAAIMEANRSSTGATINLPAGTYKLTLAGSGEAAGDLNLTTPASGNPAITISGAGAGRTIIDANHIDRAINVYPARTALIQGVTIRGGYNGDYGGAILNGGSLQLDHVDIGPLNVTDGTGGGIFNGIGGTLSLDHVSVIQNHGGTAGGIYNDGTLEVRSSSFVGNLSDQRGGGIENAGMVTVIDSTFASNAAASGGAIHNAGSLAINNSTIAGNHAQLSGGGLYAQQGAGASMLIHSSTIAYNAAYADGGADGSGGGVYIENGTSVTVRNSLLAGNYYSGSSPDAIEDCHTQGSGVLNAFGGNRISSISACSATATGWALLNSIDYLGALRNNGGSTQTIALLSGSNAIDAGNICFDTDGHTLFTDQRGFQRTVGSRCDAGAYEFDPDRIFTNGFDG